MKEGAYYDWLMNQLIKDYFFINQEMENNPRVQELGTHIFKAEAAIRELYSRVKEKEKKRNGFG